MKQKPKHHSNVCHVYPHELKSKVSPSSIISFPHQDATFHQNMKIFLTILQIFALMPLDGISASSAESLKYSFFSLRSFYSLLVLFACLAHAAIIFYYNITTGYTFSKVFPLIWFTANPFVMFQFIQMARKWPKLMHHWETFEKTITQRDPTVHKLMRRVIMAMSIPIPILAMLEHAFSLSKDATYANQCNGERDSMTTYFTETFPAFFHFFKVNYFSGISLQVINFYATIAWSMTDAFILHVSLGLITQFRHFNKHIERFKGTNHPPDIWRKQREYFTKLTELLDHVNKDLAILILTSFIVNTFYICVQLFESTRPSPSLMLRIYFWFSLLYLIGKTFLVSIVGSMINDESKKPVKVLESVPASSFGSEAFRFMQQLTTGTIALGGMQFFYLTRTFLISMIGTIVTYEIILMQFQNRQREGSHPC